ncbi:hypothetical protein [Arthrobacter sp. UYCo732]|uniref:hypothetical protein n=1 Tax=Arthrobacter sp. UYCo732 TaxID=3156336 RepID=UPI0033980339
MANDTAENIERFLSHAALLKGIRLEDLGADPDPATMTEDDREQFELEDLDELARLSTAERELHLHQAKLLAGVLWTASVIMVDKLFEDLQAVSELETITERDIDQTWILANLPARFAHRYGPMFVRMFIVVTADVTATLAREWRSPDCVAGELAVRCLLDEAEVLVEAYDLDVPTHWRSDLEDALVEDFDYDMLYDRSLDGFEDDQAFLGQFRITPIRFEQWFQPFNHSSVPPYVQD